MLNPEYGICPGCGSKDVFSSDEEDKHDPATKIDTLIHHCLCNSCARKFDQTFVLVRVSFGWSN